MYQRTGFSFRFAVWRLKPLRFTMCVSFSWIARILSEGADFCGYIVPDLHLGHIDAHPRTTSRRRPRPSDSNHRAEHTTMWFSSRHTPPRARAPRDDRRGAGSSRRGAVGWRGSRATTSRAGTRSPRSHCRAGRSRPRVNDATIVNQDAKDDGPAPVQAAMGEAATDPTPLRPMRPMRPADSTTTAETTTPVLTPIRPANGRAQAQRRSPERKRRRNRRIRRHSAPCARSSPCVPVDHVVAGIGLDESGRVDAVEAVAAAEVALEKAEGRHPEEAGPRVTRRRRAYSARLSGCWRRLRWSRSGPTTTSSSAAARTEPFAAAPGVRARGWRTTGSTTGGTSDTPPWGPRDVRGRRGGAGAHSVPDGVPGRG